MPITTCVFDAYGTLLDVNAAARDVARTSEFSYIAPLWEALAAQWRAKQLEYSWLRAVIGAHTDFWQVTEDGLDWAMEAQGLQGDVKLRARLLELYRTLAAYPEAAATLKSLKDVGLNTAILSNGSPGMLDAAVRSAGIASLLDDVLSVETVGVFKPNDRVYQMVPDRFECANDEVLFVSSNGWDAAGASGFDFTTAWVNRGGLPVDRMPARPAFIVDDLTTIPELATHG